MSAFLCSSRHISAIVNAVPARHLSNSDATAERRAAFVKLAAANAMSVDYRYNGTEATDEVRHYCYRATASVSVVEALKLAQSLEYQSCETPSWRESEAKQILDGLVSQLISALPGYGAAAWSL